ncbi:TolB family protein [Micromonospora sp. RP3T]|uniref:TolB family protein n=1 Tax=Micromonospora sp. RP3T TaxID=2135446 RepID=UPI003D70D755
MIITAVSGCTFLALGEPQVTSVAWVSQDRLYYLREDDSEISELWLRDAGRERKLASQSDMPKPCGRLDFLFAVKPGTLGLGMACDGFQRLISYSEATASFDDLLDVPSAAGVALNADGRSGYVSSGKDDCWKIQPFGDVAAGQLIDLDEFSCRAGKSAKGPVVAGGGSIVFAATNDPPPEQLKAEDRRVWRLMVASAERGEVRQVGPELHGLPDLAGVPGGGKVIVAVSYNGPANIFEIDLQSGASRRIRQADLAKSPSVSPDGRKLAFVDGKGNIFVQGLSS